MRGLELAKKTSLEICECEIVSNTATCEISLQAIENLVAEKFLDSRAVFVTWQLQNIFWGTYADKKISARAEINPEYWIEFRIFNETEELHLKRIENKFVGRYVRENFDGVGNFFADSFSRFWGENFSVAGDYVTLLDRQRKLHMEIPCAEKNFKWYGLLTRNYISSDERTGLSGYSDYRFVAIEPAGGGVDNG